VRGRRGRACAAGALRGALAQARPDIVLIDEMQDQDELLERIPVIRADAPSAKLLLLTLRMEASWLGHAFDAGIDGVISKSVHPMSLGTLIRETAHGNIVHCFSADPGASRPADCPLTKRELEILRLAAEGQTNARMARDLWVTEQTVKFHLSNVYRKLGVANRTEASRWAQLNGLLPAEALSSNVA